MNVMKPRSTSPSTLRGEAGLLRRILPVIRRRGLCAPGDSILVAVSGGPDSVALLSVLHELRPAWNLTLSVIHVNYRLRGRESDGDAEFVQRLCDELAVSCIIRSGDGIRDKVADRSSLQERAREIRYAMMRRMAEEFGLKRIALGHSADDQVETVLMWMLRGSGLTGLAGMQAMREGLFIRPLLTVSRAEILSYLRVLNRPYRTDTSNRKPIYLRNRLRRELIPYMKSIAPTFTKMISRQSEIIGEEDAFLDKMVTDLLPGVMTENDGRFILARASLLNLPLALQRRVIRRILTQLDGRGQSPRFTTVEAIIRQVVLNTAGSKLSLRDMEVLRDGEHIYIGRACSQLLGRDSPALECLCAEIPGMMEWPPTHERVHLRVVDEVEARDIMHSRDQRAAVFDGATFTFPLTLRTWKPGDRMCPSGMKGHHKKVQDLFTDLKVNRFVRHRTPLLVAPEGILWVVGRRPDDRFAVTSSTKKLVAASVDTSMKGPA